MRMTKRKPVGVGEMLVEEFMAPLGLTQSSLAKKMGVPRKHVNELCNNRRTITADTALILARVLETVPSSGSICSSGTISGTRSYAGTPRTHRACALGRGLALPMAFEPMSGGGRYNRVADLTLCRVLLMNDRRFPG